MTTNNFIRVLLADDHTLFRNGIISLLESEKDIYVVGEIDNGKDLPGKYFEIMPDLVLLDISMPGKSGLEAAKEIKQKDHKAKMLFLSMHEEDEYIYYCLKAGGMGLINKNITKGELVLAIKRVSEGSNYFRNNLSEEQIKNIYNKYDRSSLKKPTFLNNPLTSREENVLRLIGKGLTSNEIAQQLDISKRTVDSFRASIMQKLNIKNLPELIKYAIGYLENF
ncbi:MAG: response regulator transcription factor [Ignavibacteriaceae bacterium]